MLLFESMKKTGRTAIDPVVVAEEASRLFQIWHREKRLSQGEFGAKFQIGKQAAVGQFLNGDTALSFKAARGFAEGLGCTIADFSPRLAQEAELNAQFASTPPNTAPSTDIEELSNIVTRLTTTGQMQLAEVQAMVAMLKAREGPHKP